MHMHHMDEPVIRNTGAGSDKYGACDVCGKYCNATYIVGLTVIRYLDRYLMGHEECLQREVGND